MKKIHYNKLIRDKIPEVIAKDGGTFKVEKLTNKKFEKELIKKVEEEASALPKCKTRKELIEELGDVLDVIDEIKKLKKIKQTELRQAREKAFVKKGGFKKRLFLFWTSDTGYRSNEKKYRN